MRNQHLNRSGARFCRSAAARALKLFWSLLSVMLVAGSLAACDGRDLTDVLTGPGTSERIPASVAAGGGDEGEQNGRPVKRHEVE